MDIPSKNKPAAGRYALLDELRGLDLLATTVASFILRHLMDGIVDGVQIVLLGPL